MRWRQTLSKLANATAWLALAIAIGAALAGGDRVSGLALAVVAGAAVWWVAKHDQANIRRFVEAVLQYAAPSSLQRITSSRNNSGARQQFNETRKALDIAACTSVAVFAAMAVWVVGGWPLTFIDLLGKMPVQIFIMLVDAVPLALAATWLVLRLAAQTRSGPGPT